MSAHARDTALPRDDDNDVTALYLAHLNPVTNAHVGIISDLLKRARTVKVMPVVFRRSGRGRKEESEINSRSFPFSFEARRDMLESVFGSSVVISDDYTFYAPFWRYMPPLLSPLSWRLRSRVLCGVRGDYFSYTGDRAEGYMLKLYMLKPHTGRRRPLSAASVKERMYADALGQSAKGTLWDKDVPDGVASIIREQWHTVVRFADVPDDTMRILGMKFPKHTAAAENKL